MRQRSALAVTAVLLAAPMCAQSPLRDIERALDAGQSWQATQLAAPLLARADTRTPEAIILAARAAAGWEGWSTVRSLLEKEPWLDSRFDRLGRRLLAEAALGMQRNPQALIEARASVVGGTGRDVGEQGLRVVLLARALDRADQRDSAAAAYRDAAVLLPVAGEWLRLRAAGVTTDASARQTLFQGVTSGAAAPRIAWTEAQALERIGNAAAAAEAYGRLGATASSLRLRWAAARTDAERSAVRAALMAQLRPGVSAGAARDALILIERTPVVVSGAERLAVARRAADVGRAAQAADAFGAAAKSAPLSGADRFAYGKALTDLGRWPDAAVQFRGVTDPSLAGHAAYLNARALLRSGKGGEAIAALERVVAAFPGDTLATGTALFLLGDLAVDGGDVERARKWFSQLGNRYPTSSFAPRGALLAALIPMARNDPATAERELRRALGTYATSSEGDAIRYWLARATAATGRQVTADSLLRTLLARGPESYYATRAAIRLDTVPWSSSEPPLSSADSLATTFARVALLERIGLETEARHELDFLGTRASTASTLLVIAEAMREQGHTARASQLGQRAIAAGAPRDARIYRLIYPLPWADALLAAGEREDVDALLAASVIRQESAFQPHATSRTDARGLMQVMPSVGKELGRNFGFTDLDPALLWQPELNISLGMRHFGNALKRYPEPERALAAYNAGQSRVNRWTATLLSGPNNRPVTAPLDDVELFVERIPFIETRDYVRIVIRNAAMYRMLYGG
ncbi:MAG: tetratricopeptide repeat protein [Gemmatimonadales bacterium]|nr:tetratricopeptide repeat protein [Gemmatimonadales bacterium]